jgi:hypothetical protein
MTPAELFTLVCYQTLTTREPMIEYSPGYLAEKFETAFARGVDAFAMLDYGNQRRCIAYCAKWSVPIPLAVTEYVAATEQALRELTESE